MKLATYEWQGHRSVGVLDAHSGELREVAGGADAAPAWNMVDVIRIMGEGGAISGHAAGGVSLREARLLAPIPLPRRNLWAVGRNYRTHAAELSGSVFKSNDNDVAAWPIVFTKVPETVVGPFDDVPLASDITQSVDYEAELAVVIGRKGKNISKTEAMRHVFGYTIINDVTARDVQMRHQQWDMGKSFDAFCPMGPYIVTADEFDGADTRVRCWVNGELRQDAFTRDLIFDVPTLIETISRGITLLPGDVIATGTPAGVGMGMKPPRYLRSGDVVRIEIDGLGVIENRFV